MVKVYTFDVFDTLVTRKVSLPQHIFLLTGIRIKEKLEIDLEPELFAAARIAIENELDKQAGILSDIHSVYQRLTERLEISDDIAEKILIIELEIEFENLVTVDKNVRLLNTLRNDGSQIVYISDSYLGKYIIKKFLFDLGIYSTGEDIYVSCEYGALKSSGELFEIVSDELGISKDELHHFGNSKKSDIQGAELAGISRTLLPEGNLNRYEKYLSTVNKTYRLCAEKAIIYSKIAAASRIARSQRKDEDQNIYDIACSVAAPVLYKFVSYVLENAKGKTIYFLARDGYIMYRIAKKIMETKQYQAEVKYFYISREVLIFAAIDEIGYKKFIEYIHKIYDHETLCYLFNLFSINERSIETSISGDLNLKQKISEIDTETLNRIFKNRSIQKQIIRESRKRKERLIAYIKAEGMLDNEDITIVDTGWYLTIQNILAIFLTKLGQKTPEGFYFGINESSYSSLSTGKKKGYFWDFRRGKFITIAPGCSLLLEVLCSAPHGRTIDYRVNGTSVQPVLDNFEKDHLIDWGVKDLENGILITVDKLLEHDELLKPIKNDPTILSDLIKLFWLQPSYDEVEVWGSYPFVITRDGKNVITLHNRKPFLKLLKHVVIKGNLPNKGNSFWPYAQIYSLKYFKRTTVKYSLRLKKKLFFFKRMSVQDD